MRPLLILLLVIPFIQSRRLSAKLFLTDPVDEVIPQDKLSQVTVFDDDDVLMRKDLAKETKRQTMHLARQLRKKTEWTAQQDLKRNLGLIKLSALNQLKDIEKFNRRSSASIKLRASFRAKQAMDAFRKVRMNAELAIQRGKQNLLKAQENLGLKQRKVRHHRNAVVNKILHTQDSMKNNLLMRKQLIQEKLVNVNHAIEKAQMAPKNLKEKLGDSIEKTNLLYKKSLEALPLKEKRSLATIQASYHQRKASILEQSLAAKLAVKSEYQKALAAIQKQEGTAILGSKSNWLTRKRVLAKAKAFEIYKIKSKFNYKVKQAKLHRNAAIHEAEKQRFVKESSIRAKLKRNILMAKSKYFNSITILKARIRHLKIKENEAIHIKHTIGEYADEDLKQSDFKQSAHEHIHSVNLAALRLKRKRLQGKLYYLETHYAHLKEKMEFKYSREMERIQVKETLTIRRAKIRFARKLKKITLKKTLLVERAEEKYNHKMELCDLYK